MASLKEEAENYKAPQLKNVADLEFIDVSMDVQTETECEFPYKYIMKDGERYKVPNSVIADINQILLSSKNITKFKVLKSGQGMKTKYTIIPLQ